ncbi:hypothetical protein FDF74_03845 [Clostridium niameyense]|uniref:Uncharacterized protein n=1 Tax=Clostridium niameyense TaxID=1622073 RepID=A0A6M0R815_9CLOT|nr:hypothetical protein [Clostridium niameyense]NEZ46344.1 hypothetical protein [Clostridium niameyense]
MGKFNDFDLDLKKVESQNRVITENGYEKTKLTLKGIFKSVSAATTGMTVGCCARKANDNVHRCI